jgi:PAS domain S-box-containing protein
MLDLIRHFLSAGSFIPHGHCYLWKPALVSLHVFSDLAIALSYYSIPITLFYFVQRRKDLPFNWIFILFAAFITACGTSHLISVWTLWYPTYWLSGGIKAITAVVSFSTAIALLKLMPKALVVPSAGQLEMANRALQEEMMERERIEAQRQQAEQALRISEARYRAIVEDQTELISRFLADGTILFVNESYCQYFGIQQADILGRSYEPVIFEEDRETVTQLIQSMSAANPTITIENRVVVKGEVRWTQWVNRMLFDEQGYFVEVQSVGRDITERKALEREAEESKKILDALMEYIPEGITIADAPDVMIRRISKYGEQLAGQPRDILEGISVNQHASTWGIFCADGITPANNQDLPLTRAVQQGEVVTNEEWVLCPPSGKKITIHCNAGPIQDQEGNVTGGIIAWRDVTARKQAEEQLQASLREKEVLLKEIHHRVKNNLQIVYSLLRLQRRRLKDQLAANVLLESQSRIESIALIHEKLYQSEDLARINLAEYIPSLATNLFSTYNVNNQQIGLNTAIEPIFLDIDKAIRCGLIINELLSNSLKYAFSDADQGNLRIWIKLFTTAETPTITLIVGDNGMSIPGSIDFSNLETLGLQLVQGFVGQLKGTLQMHCQGGTEFHIMFPRDVP